MFKKGVITDEISQDLAVAADLAVKYGLDGVEIRSIWDKGPHQLNDADIKKAKDILKERGLEVCGISAPFFKCNIDSDNEIKQQFEILDRCIHLAHELNAPFIRGFTFWAKGSFDDYFDTIVAHIKDASKVLDGTGITLVIEMDPSVFAGTAEKVARVVAAVNAENVKALFDPGNLIWNPNHEIPYPDGYNILKPYIAHIHIKDAKTVKGITDAVAVGTGEVDYVGQFKQLIKDNYNGYIVLETHYRKAAVISEALLQLPGGKEFSNGAYEATNESLKLLTEMLNKLA